MTADLRLSPLWGSEDPDSFAALAAPGHFGEADEPRLALEQTRSFLEANPRPDPWGSYLAWHGDTAVGLCAFKSAPDPSGAVEIAYTAFPAYRGRGFAKAMIACLHRLASRSGASLIVAHTLPEDNASNGALRRAGFRFASEVVDPDDGPVWRWEKPA